MTKTNAEVDITYFLPCSPTTRNFSLFFYHGFFFHMKFKINRTVGEKGGLILTPLYRLNL